jgi:hypothetical protein
VQFAALAHGVVKAGYRVTRAPALSSMLCRSAARPRSDNAMPGQTHRRSAPRRATPLFIALAVVLSALWAGAHGMPSAQAQDRHEGYYYPEVTVRETYPARAATLPDSDRLRRIAFVVALAQEQTARPYPPRWAIFAKGTEAEKLLIIAMEDGVIATIHQARAMLAMMTAVTRGLPGFDDTAVEDSYTFLDLLAIMGFERLTVSDGRSYALQFDIELQPPGGQ